MARARTLFLNTKVSVTGEDKLKGLGATFKKVFSPQNLAVGGIALAGALTAGLAAATRALIDIERLNAQTAAVIKSTGGVANVTQQGIEDLAESAEDLTTIEREVVQEGANMLLTFTNVRNEVGKGNDIFNQATEAVLDMSVALGTDAQSAALQLGKALNDPIKGMAQLSRAGIQFTDSQKELVKALVASGDLLGAQKVILAELETQFGGSAEAFANTTAGRIQRFQNDVGDAFESIIVGATKVADFLGQEVDLWPFDDQAEIIKANAASMGVDAGNAYAAGVAAQVTAGKAGVTTAAQLGITDPLLAEMLVAEENANLSGHQVVLKYAVGLLTPQTDVETAIATALQVVEDEMSRTEEFAYLSGQLVILQEARGLASAEGKTASITAIDAAMAAIRERMGVLPGEAYTSGYGVVTEYSKGMWAGIWQISDAANEVASRVGNTIGVLSEPKDHSSPLYGITKWGGNLAKTYAAGIDNELGTLRAAAGRMAGAMVPSFGGSLVASRVPVSPQPSSGARDIHIHLNIGGDLKAEERTLPGIIVRGLNAAGIP